MGEWAACETEQLLTRFAATCRDEADLAKRWRNWKRLSTPAGCRRASPVSWPRVRLHAG